MASIHSHYGGIMCGINGKEWCICERELLKTNQNINIQ